VNKYSKFFLILTIAVVGLAILAVAGDSYLKNYELKSGVAAYRAGNYDAAISHFQKAAKLELNPGTTVAKEYLATALAQKVVPGLETPDNMQNAQHAIDVFQQVLAKKPHDVDSMKMIAGIELNIKNLEEAKAWQKKALAEDPRDPEAAYIVGAIDWMEAHQNVLEALGPAGFNDDGEGNAKVPAKVMKPLKDKNAPLVADGLEYLNQALENRPNYVDVMVYLNLMYRSKADLDYGNEAARKMDVAKAEEWRRKAFATRKAN
jgi:tetratricopeptide (TPR) repeat protein